MALALKFRGVVVGLAALLCALAPLAPVSRAAAHANLVAADPAPNAVLDISPGRVVLKFTEEISPNFSDISVLDTLGDRVDKKDAAVLPNDPVSIAVSLPELPKGSYTVSWRNLSNIDGHAVRGSYAFSIGVPVVAPPALQAPLLQSPAQPYLRWGMLIGAMGFFAAISFRLLVLTPALAGQSSDTARKATGRVVARLGRGFGLLFVAASLGLLLTQAAVAGDVSLLKLAMLHDPLVGAICDPEEVWQMTDEMLAAQAEWLPQYADEIEKAEARLADHAANGTGVKTMDGFRGVARIATESAS